MESSQPKVQPRSHICTPGNVKEWTHTFPSELPVWELESLWSFEYSKRYFNNQISLDQRVLYTIEKLLKLRCLKWACITHLSTCNTSYSQNKGQELKCQFDFRPLKIKNRPEIHVCNRRATYHWKALNVVYNFALDLASIKKIFTRNYGPPKFWESQFQKNWDSRPPSWESWDKMTLGCNPHG
jgi:hypothetical protein